MNELIQIGPISPLRQRLLDDMAMRRFGPVSYTHLTLPTNREV